MMKVFLLEAIAPFRHGPPRRRVNTVREIDQPSEGFIVQLRRVHKQTLSLPRDDFRLELGEHLGGTVVAFAGLWLTTGPAWNPLRLSFSNSARSQVQRHALLADRGTAGTRRRRRPTRTVRHRRGKNLSRRGIRRLFISSSERSGDRG